MTEIGDYIVQRMRELDDMSQVDLSRMSGVSTAEISRIISGQRVQPSAKVLDKLAKPLRVKPKDLYRKAGYAADMIGDDGQAMRITHRLPAPNIESYPVGATVRIPLIGEVRCGSAGIAEEIPEGTMAADLDMFSFILPDLRNWYWLRIKGDSMRGAGYHPGGIALIHKQDTIESGEIGVVMVDSECATLKRVIWHKDLGVIELRPDNDNYQSVLYPIGEVHILGKAHAAVSFS